MKFQLAALFCLVALGACVDQADPSDDTVTADPRIATNGLVPTAIHANGLNAAALTPFSIPAAKAMEDTADHRNYTAYLVGCGLASNQCVTSTSGYTYCGVIGIAPAWTNRALTAAETGEISACVLTRANLTGTTVTISIRSDNAALATTPDEVSYYQTEEAAFYGNVFTTTAGAKHACNGVDQVTYGDTYGDLPLRQCGQPDPNNPGYTLCGFVFDGNCADICTRTGDHYSQCGSHVNVETAWLAGSPR